MNEMDHRRKVIAKSCGFIAKNTSLSSLMIKNELEGERRLRPSKKELRIQTEEYRVAKDKRILTRVGKVVNDGYDGVPAEELSAMIGYLLDRGYTVADIKAQKEIPSVIMPFVVELPKLQTE